MTRLKHPLIDGEGTKDRRKRLRREANARYRKSPAGKAAIANYYATHRDHILEQQAGYRATPAGVARTIRSHAKRQALADDIRKDILATPAHERRELALILKEVAERVPRVRAALAQYTVDYLIGEHLEDEA